jgi:hypothetical protein
MQHLKRRADVDDDVLRGELFPVEGHIDHEGGPMQALGRTKNGSGRLCAIMMRSRTSTAYMISLLLIRLRDSG